MASSSASVVAAPAAAAAAPATITVPQLRQLMGWLDGYTFARGAAQDLMEDLVDLLDPVCSRRDCPAAQQHVISVSPRNEAEPDCYFLSRNSRQTACHASPATMCFYAVEIKVPPQSDELARLLARSFAQLEPQHRAYEEEKQRQLDALKPSPPRAKRARQYDKPQKRARKRAQ